MAIRAARYYNSNTPLFQLTWSQEIPALLVNTPHGARSRFERDSGTNLTRVCTPPQPNGCAPNSRNLRVGERETVVGEAKAIRRHAVSQAAGERGPLSGHRHDDRSPSALIAPAWMRQGR